jgi:hypothetical protein
MPKNAISQPNSSSVNLGSEANLCKSASGMLIPPDMFVSRDHSPVLRAYFVLSNGFM